MSYCGLRGWWVGGDRGGLNVWGRWVGGWVVRLTSRGEHATDGGGGFAQVVMGDLGEEEVVGDVPVRDVVGEV